jgi:hypothetical protein
MTLGCVQLPGMQGFAGPSSFGGVGDTAQAAAIAAFEGK